ncbi:MAG: hypothetical protein F6J93_14510 [Oscillatoria sp. SIO1A7]|nr:hypothetical protein [Oscillatoria sp. SIO1A7]
MLNRCNISWPLDLPPKLKAITSEDYQVTNKQIVKFIESVERGEQAELILNAREINCLQQPSYDNYSKLSVSSKKLTQIKSYDIQNDVVIEEDIARTGF